MKKQRKETIINFIKYTVLYSVLVIIFIGTANYFVRTENAEDRDERHRRNDLLHHIKGDVDLVRLYIKANSDGHISKSEHESILSVPNKGESNDQD